MPHPAQPTRRPSDTEPVTSDVPWHGSTPAEVAAWALGPDEPGASFVDVMALSEDDLRWLRERPVEPDTLGGPAGDPDDEVRARPRPETVTGVGPEEPFWATPGVTPPSSAPTIPPRLSAAQEAVVALLGGGPLSGSRADTEAVLRLAEQAQAAALAELAEMDATGGHLTDDVRGTTTETWLRDTLRLSDPTARATVRTAVRLRDELPALGRGHR